MVRIARALGSRLERGHLNAPFKRRLRWTVPVMLLAAATAVLLLRPRDPAHDIDAQYADVPALLTQVHDEEWDEQTRREFREALAGVDRAIALAQDAVRRSPKNEAFRELCHLAHRARRRLIEAHISRG
jgi:hypothetical protein